MNSFIHSFTQAGQTPKVNSRQLGLAYGFVTGLSKPSLEKPPKVGGPMGPFARATGHFPGGTLPLHKDAVLR